MKLWGKLFHTSVTTALAFFSEAAGLDCFLDAIFAEPGAQGLTQEALR